MGKIYFSRKVTGRTATFTVAVNMDETNTDEVAYTYIILNDDPSNYVAYRSNGSIGSLDLSNLELAIFAGCYTGYGGEYAPNLPSAAVMQGARTAIGFSGEIDCILTRHWTVQLFEQLQSGKTIGQAIDSIKINFVGSPLENPIICGDQTTKITE